MREIMAPDFSRLTTLRLGGKAIALCEPESEADLAGLGVRATELGGKVYVIGRGSNLLARDGEIPLVLVGLRAWQGLRITERTRDGILVEAGAGVTLPRLLRFCLANELSGLEGLSGVPGSVGGACAMNAGSFGVETGMKIQALQVLGKDGLKWVGRQELNFAYRSLKIKGFNQLPLIAKAIFALTQGAKSAIFSKMSLNFFTKKSRQPLGVPSAGCAFRNPPGGPTAGRLLEEAGFRGRRLGGVAFSAKHANFLVNEANGTATEAFSLLEDAVESVYRRSGIRLEPEIGLIR